MTLPKTGVDMGKGRQCYNELDRRLWKISAEEFYGDRYADFNEDMDSSNFCNSGGDYEDEDIEKDKRMLKNCNTFEDNQTKEKMPKGKTEQFRTRRTGEQQL